MPGEPAAALRVGRIAGHLRAPAALPPTPATSPSPASADPPPLRFAIVGAGMISQLHAAVLGSIDGAELVAVCSRDLSRAAEITDEHGGEPTTDYEALLVIDPPHPDDHLSWPG